MSSCLRGCVVIAVTVRLFGGVVAAQATDPLPEHVRKLEADNQFVAARAMLLQLKTTANAADVDAHIALIDNTLNLFGVTDVLANAELHQNALDGLTVFLPKVSNPRDAYLAVAVQRRIGNLRQRLADLQRESASERAARDALTRADTLFARRLYKEANTAYADVSKLPTISAESKARADRGVAKASQADFDAQPVGTIATVYRSLGTTATTLGEWGLTILAVAPLVALLALGRRLWVTNTRSLELADLTLVVPSPPANRELAQQLEDVLARVRLADRGAARLETRASGEPINDEEADLPPPDLVFVTSSAEVPGLAVELEQFVAAAPTVQVGAIGFNPKQLLSLARFLLKRRSRYAFSGSLLNYDNTLVLRLTREDRLFGRRIEWRSSAPSTSTTARITCLVDVGCRIVLDTQSVDLATGDFESLKSYVLGLYALGSEETPDRLKIAGSHFRDALTRDGRNWLARFRLAFVHRSLGETRDAIRQLNWFLGPEALLSKSLQMHLQKHPEFLHVVKYHLASTLAIQADPADDADVSRLLVELIGLECSRVGSCLDPVDRRHLIMLARSGHSTWMAARVSRRPGAPTRDELAEVRQRVNDQLTWLNAHREPLEREVPTGYPLARGIVLHAYGRLQYASGDGSGAVRSLTEAVDLLPGYADVRVDLAKVYLERKKDSNWPQRVTELLDRALALDASSAKARFVYARFYMADATRDFTKAESYLTTAPFDPVSLFMYARILSHRERHAETLDTLERAIALQPKGPTFRIRLYAESLHALATADPAARILDRSRRRLCQYDQLIEPEERDNANYKRIVAIYREICTRMNYQPADECFRAPSAPNTKPAGPQQPVV